MPVRSAGRDLHLTPVARDTHTHRSAAHVSSLLFVAFAVSVCFRFAVPNNVLNALESYTTFSPLDSFLSYLEKIHPGTYGIFVIGVLLFPRIFGKWLTDQDRVMHAMAMMSITVGIVLAICVVTGQTDAVGYLIDSLLAAAVAGCVALCFPTSQRWFLGNALLLIILLSSLLAIAEFFAKTRLLPQQIIVPDTDASFRATGLSDHPLSLALYNVVAIPFVYLTNWTRAIKLLAISVLVTGIFAAGARVGAAVAMFLAIFIMFISIRQRRLEIGSLILGKSVVIVGGVILIAIVWFVGSAIGLTERFQQVGLIDDSTMARITIFQVFGFVDWRDLIWGPGNFALYKYSNFGLHIPYVENSLIVYIFQFGIIGALCLLGALTYSLYRLGRHAQLALKTALITFLVVALTNNTLSIKSPGVTLIFILAIAFRHTTAADQKKRIGKLKVLASAPFQTNL